MAKNAQEVAAAVMAEVKERTLSGGRLDKARVSETAGTIRKEEAKVTVGRWYISGNAGAYEIFVGLAQQKGVQVAERPANAEVALREVDEGAFILVKPLKGSEPGMSVTYPKKQPRSMRISKLHAFLQRNNLIPDAGTVFVAPAEIGRDSELGRCLIINVTEAKQRLIAKRPKKKNEAAAAKPQEQPAPAVETK